MDRRKFLKSSFLTTGLFLTGCDKLGNMLPGAKTSKKPNVILINIDDMGYGDMSCHGNPQFKTPNLDQLHSESIRFTQFHAAPSCTPTRGQLLTGMDALKNGARMVGTENTHLRSDLPTLPEILKDSGYRTGMFGKWHIGSNYPFRPQDRGFDDVVWFPQQEVGTVKDYFTNNYFNDTYMDKNVHKKYDGYCTDVWFNLAMEWMQNKTKNNEPFFCMIPTNVVHGPYFVEQKYRDRVKISNLPKQFETFFGMLINLDDNIGKLDHFLRRKGLYENTIVIFMTDNGGTAGYSTYNAGMKGMKTQLWEGGHRVPCFIRWPNGKLSEPKDINELVQAQDLLPTLIDLCNVKKPANAEFDGISLAPTLKGKAGIPDRVLVIQFQRFLEIKKWDACIMWGPWRLVNLFDIDPKLRDEEKIKDIKQRQKNYEIKLGLFNVEEDPHQDNDVIDQHPEIVAQIKEHYEKWWQNVQDEMKIPRRIIIGNPAENPTFLACDSWAATYFTQKSRVMEGSRANGYWNLIVDSPGEYEIALRRWPKEADTPISGKTNYTYYDDYSYGKTAEGKALPIKNARLKIADFDQSKPVKPEDKEIVFNVNLAAGNTELQTWFYDENNEWLCGAYYVYVLKK